jgi:hypothetical protein
MKADAKTMKTGQTVIENGLYSSDCCNHEQIFKAGDNFTRCLACMALCEWDLDTELATVEELENIEAIAA